MKLIISFTCLVICILISCKHSSENIKDISNSTTNSEIENKDSIPTNSQDFNLSHLKEFPKSLEGCSCYLSENETFFKSHSFFFVTDMEKKAFIAIDEKWIELLLISTTKEMNTFGDYDYEEVYESENYKVELDVQYVGVHGDETWRNKGSIKVHSKDGEIKSISFVGECGC